MSEDRPANYRETRIFVIAPSYTIARNWAEIDNGLHRDQWRYVYSPEDLYGHRDFQYAVVHYPWAQGNALRRVVETCEVARSRPGAVCINDSGPS